MARRGGQRSSSLSPQPTASLVGVVAHEGSSVAFDGRCRCMSGGRRTIGAGSSHSHAPFLECRVERVSSTVTVRVRGHLDRTTATSARAVLLPAVQLTEAVILDLSALRFIDTAGLAVLVSAVRTARTLGRPATVVHVQPTVGRMLRSIEFDRIVEIAA